MNDLVLFLDFDGVLHPLGEPALGDNFELLPNPDLFCWRHHLESVLAPYPDVRIMVSSDWRRLFDDAKLVELLGPVLASRFAGVVEVNRPSRAEEVLAEADRRGLRCWLALDDHTSVKAAAEAGDDRFIVCRPDSGLSDPAVKALLACRLAELLG